MLRSCHGISKLAAVLLLATVVVVSGGAVVVYEHLSSSPESKIDLRFTGTDPPDPEPQCVLYRDIVDLPDPTWLGLTIRYFDDDVVALYFQITGDNANYSFQTVQLGMLAAGTNDYKNLDAFASRSKPLPADLPGGEWMESVDLVLKAYADAAYTNLKWTFTKTLFIHWINSIDAAWTQDVLNSFDDGTVQGWAVAVEAGGGYGATLTVAADYYLSTNGSLKVSEHIGEPGSPDSVHLKYLQVWGNSTSLVFLGKPCDTVRSDYLPQSTWMRIVVPLTPNTELTVKVQQDVEAFANYVAPYGETRFNIYKTFTTANKPEVFAIINVRMYSCASYKLPGGTYWALADFLWLDDFKIISK